jgi:transcriptional regulator with GAF, ATPase, and Fis domain
MTSYPLDATTSPATDGACDASTRSNAGYLRCVWSVDGERSGARCQLGDALLLVGREQHDGGFGARDPRLSRVHARLVFDTRSGAIRIGDARSRNGTFVNGQLVETALLSHGDVIRVGDTVLVYEHHDAMERVREQIAGAAKLDSAVLLRGETGTGKELIARAIHEHSGRPGAFVPVNCASVPLELASSEFFGHTKHAFSGAAQTRTGMFVDASRGTLFLDEIGDCPMPIQLVLLRALQEKAVRPVGSGREVAVDVRIVAATHRDLEHAITRGLFRADLFARLAQIQVTIPPLRERRSQIVALLQELAAAQGFALELTADAVEALLCWCWPFNVRELQAMLQTSIARGLLAGTLGLDELHDLCPELARPIRERRGRSQRDDARPSSPIGDASQRQRLRASLAKHAGNISAVAHELGKPRAQIYRWLKAMGLSARNFRA